MTDRAADVGVELGGTKIVVGASFQDRDIARRIRIATEEPHETLDAVRSAIDEVAAEGGVNSIGIGSFGPVDLRPTSATFGTMISTPKPGWSGVDVLGGVVGDRSVPVGIDTDVAAALLAEHRWGAATARVNAYFTVGTGIGAAIISGDRIITGANHSEIGHVRVPRHPDDDFGGQCPYHGDCLEGMACGPALEERFGASLRSLEGSAQARATELAGWYLAHGIASMAAVVPVENVVVGGGVAHLPDLHAVVARQLEEASGGYPPIPFGEGGPAVVPPALGDDAGVLGAILIGRTAAEAT